MKRLSNKKRKLNYIREKNGYRKGFRGISFFKISNEVLGDAEFVKSYTERFIEDTFRSLSRKFKMPFEIISFDSGLDGDDFIQNVTTVRFTFKRKESRYTYQNDEFFG